MRKILLFSMLLLGLGCSSRYSSDDFVGEYVLYLENGKLLYNGEPAIKIYKERDTLYLTNLQNKDTVSMGLLSKKYIDSLIEDNLFIYKLKVTDGIDWIKEDKRNKKAYSVYKIKESKRDFPISSNLFFGSYERTGYLKKVK